MSTRRLAAAGLAALAAGGGLAACGGGSDNGGGSSSAARGAGPGASGAALASNTVAMADCNLWSVLNARQREDLLTAMRGVFGARIDQPQGRGPTLTDAQATSVIGEFCSRKFAGRFKLYKIYGRAAAFESPGG